MFAAIEIMQLAATAMPVQRVAPKELPDWRDAKAYRAAYYEQNREHILARQRENYQKHREKRLQSARERYHNQKSGE